MLGADASLWMDDPSMNFWLAIVAAATAAMDVATATPLVRAYVDLRGLERCENHRRLLNVGFACLLNIYVTEVRNAPALPRQRGPFKFKLQASSPTARRIQNSEDRECI